MRVAIGSAGCAQLLLASGRAWRRCVSLPWLATALLGACTTEEKGSQELLTESTTEGGQVGALVAPVGRTALLVYNPDTCLGCNSSLAAWEAVARRGEVTVVLVLTKPPSEEQARTLRNQRVSYAAILQRGWSHAPAEYVFDNHREVGRAEGRAQISGVRLWELRR